MKPATSNLASRWGLPSPIIKSHAEEKWACRWSRGAPQNFGVLATAEASDFKIGKRLGFEKAHRKIPPRKSGLGPKLGKLPKILGFLFNISAMAETSDFKFGMQLGFAKTHHTITP